jgi:hypothetical protein
MDTTATPNQDSDPYAKTAAMLAAEDEDPYAKTAAMLASEDEDPYAKTAAMLSKQDDQERNDMVFNLITTNPTFTSKKAKHLAEELIKEQGRRDIYLSRLDEPAKLQEAGQYTDIDPRHEKVYDPVSSFIGGIGETIDRALTGDQKPSLAIHEIQAARSTEDQKSPSFQKFLGSTVNLATSLLPGGKSPGQAWDEFSMYDQENMRKKLKRVYSKPIIDKNGMVDKEALEYSRLPLQMYNELKVLWVAQQTGIKNVELLRNVVKGRAGVTMDDSALERGGKQLIQMVDSAAFNIPSAKWTKHTARAEIDALFEEKKIPDPPLQPGQTLTMDEAIKRSAGTGAQEALVAAPFFTEPKKVNGEWITSMRDGTPVRLEDYDPNLPEPERRRLVQKAIVNTALAELEIDSQYVGAQVVDPTILFGVGIGKQVAKGAMKAIPKGSHAAEVATRWGARMSPYAENAGAFTAAAKVAQQTTIPVVSRAAQQIVNTATSASTAGKVLRFSDRALTNAALFSVLASEGAPEGMERDYAAGAALMSLGLSPVYMMQTWKPTRATFSDYNQQVLKDLYRNESFDELSNYSKKYVIDDMKKYGIKDYKEYRTYVGTRDHIERQGSKYADWIRNSEMTPAMAMRLHEEMAADAQFRRDWDARSRVFDDKGVSWYGTHAKLSLWKVIKQQEDHVKNLTSSGTSPVAGTQSIVPGATNAEHRLRLMKEFYDNLQPHIVSDKNRLMKALDETIADTGGPGVLGIGAESAKQWKSVLTGIDEKEIYKPAAVMDIIINTALREADDKTRVSAMGHLYRNYIDLIDNLQAMPEEAMQNLLRQIGSIDASMGREGPIHKVVRRSQKTDLEDISPAAASRELAEDFYTAMNRLPALIEAESNFRRLAKQENVEKPNAHVAQFYSDQADAIQAQIRDIRNSTFVAKMLGFARQKSSEIVRLKGEIRTEKIKQLHDEARLDWDIEQQTGKDKTLTKDEKRAFRGVVQERKLIAEKSRLDAIRAKSDLQAHAINLREIATRKQDELSTLASLIYRMYDSDTTKAGSPSRPREIVRSNILHKNRRLFPKGVDKATILKPETMAMIKKASKVREESIIYARRAALAEESLAGYDERSVKNFNRAEELDASEVNSNRDYGEAAKWFDNMLATAPAVGIHTSNFYQNLRNAIVDQLEPQMVAGVKIPKAVEPELIAGLRLLGDDKWLEKIGMPSRGVKKGDLIILRRSANVLADRLALMTEQSRSAEAALRSIEDAVTNPAKTKLSDLMAAQRALDDEIFIPQFLDELHKKDGIFSKIEALVEAKTNGYLSTDEWRTLQILAKDSAIGKAYRTQQQFLEDGLLEPWMITYKQDIIRMLDALSSSGKTMDRITNEVAEFFVRTGHLATKESFDVKIAAAVAMRDADTYGLPSYQIADLLGLARELHDNVTNHLQGFQQTDQLAVSLSRQLGVDVYGDLSTLFEAANAAAAYRDTVAKPLLQELDRIESNKVKFRDVGPQDGIRQVMTKAMIGVEGHDAIPTTNTAFVKSGIHDSRIEVPVSPMKEAHRPMDVEGETQMYLTDHIIVDGQLTAFGHAYKLWHSLEGPAQETVREAAARRLGVWDSKRKDVVGDISPEDRTVFDFLVRQMSFYGRLQNMDEFTVLEKALGAIQRADRKALEDINALSRSRNSLEGTNYPDIVYEPWRLDTEVPTKNDIVSFDGALLGSYADVDRILGQRYLSTARGQIEKAQSSGIKEKDVFLSPPELFLNRVTRLHNDVHSRKARSSLARKAQFIEFMGYNQQAETLKEFIIGASDVKFKDEAWYKKISRWTEETGIAPVRFGNLLLRQVSNPFIMLSGFMPTSIEQPLQSAIMQMSANPSLKGLGAAAANVFRYSKDRVPRWFVGLGQSMVTRMDKLNTETNGRTIKFSGPQAAILESVYEGVTKRSDPWVAAKLREYARGGTPFMKAFSRGSAEARFAPESVTLKQMFLLKEGAENTAARAALPQAGAIWQNAMEKFSKGGDGELYKYLSSWLTGPYANDAFIFDLVSKVKAGKQAEAMHSFATAYVSSVIGNWNHSNIPKYWRVAARIVPYADQFYTAATTGMHRGMMSILNMKGLTPAQRAMGVMGVMTSMGIATGMAYMSDETGIDWFQRLSPMQPVSQFAQRAARKKLSSETLSDVFLSVGTRQEIRAGATVAMSSRQIQTALKLLAMYAEGGDVIEKDPLKKQRQRDKIDKYMSVFLDPTFLRTLAGLSGRTTGDIMVQGQHLYQGLATSTITEEDVMILRESLKAANEEAVDLQKRYRSAEAREGQSILSPTQELSLGLMEAFAGLSLDFQEALWAEIGYGEFREPSGLPHDARILSSGARGSDAIARQMFTVLKQRIEAWEAQKRQNMKLVGGVDQAQDRNTEVMPTPMP